MRFALPVPCMHSCSSGVLWFGGATPPPRLPAPRGGREHHDIGGRGFQGARPPGGGDHDIGRGEGAQNFGSHPPLPPSPPSSLLMRMAPSLALALQVQLTGQSSGADGSLKLQTSRSWTSVPGTSSLTLLLGTKQRLLSLAHTLSFRGANVHAEVLVPPKGLPHCSLSLSPVEPLYKGISGSLDIDASRSPEVGVTLRGLQWKGVKLNTVMSVGAQPRQCRLKATVTKSSNTNSRMALATMVYHPLQRTWYAGVKGPGGCGVEGVR